MVQPKPDIDILAIGETLIDFISTEHVPGLAHAKTFQRHQGGSPANIAVTAARLGGQTAIISKTGIGAFGQFLKAELRHHGVETTYLAMDHKVHTSVVFVSRTTGTPEFEAFRDGDFKLSPSEVHEEAIARSRVVHASTFALSRKPCRLAVKKAFQMAHEQGKIVSFDPNYSPVIWPDYAKAQKVIRTMFRYTTITKASLDDAHRLFGPGEQPQTYVEMLHELGPQTVVFTMGSRGALVSHDGHLRGYLPARPISVADATGAGDSFWAGFLMALLDGHSLEESLLFAREIVEMKLTTVGPLPTELNREQLYATMPPASTAITLNWPTLPRQD